MRKVLLLVSITTLLYSMTSVAGSNDDGTHYSIVSVFPTGGGLHLQLDPRPVKCAPGNGNWWGTQAYISMNTGNYASLSAGIYTAFASGKKITSLHFGFNGDNSCSSGNQLSITAFRVLR
ncbi:MAG: hypothetical protein JKY67_17490 [Pseudomonadales bacterium]|nr:hypothetical protein [Pseudomonadales bacterium]